jgi:hypothetical protein
MRVWLLVISSVVAAYLAWTSSLFGGGALGMSDGEDEALNDRAAKVKSRVGKKGAMSWRDWGWFVVDGLTGKYLYGVAVNGGGRAGSQRGTRRSARRKQD